MENMRGKVENQEILGQEHFTGELFQIFKTSGRVNLYFIETLPEQKKMKYFPTHSARQDNSNIKKLCKESIDKGKENYR